MTAELLPQKNRDSRGHLWGQPPPPKTGAQHGAGSGPATCRSSLSLPTTAALLQSITSEKGSSQPSLSSTGMQAACEGPHRGWDRARGPHNRVPCPPHPPQSPPVPAAPPGSERSPGAGRGARCRRWSCAAAPGSQTFLGDVGGVRHCPPHPHKPHRLLLAPYKAGHPSCGVGMDQGWAWWGCSPLGGAHQGNRWQSQEPNSPQKAGSGDPRRYPGGSTAPSTPPHNTAPKPPSPKSR